MTVWCGVAGSSRILWKDGHPELVSGSLLVLGGVIQLEFGGKDTDGGEGNSVVMGRGIL